MPVHHEYPNAPRQHCLSTHQCHQIWMVTGFFPKLKLSYHIKAGLVSVTARILTLVFFVSSASSFSFPVIDLIFHVLYSIVPSPRQFRLRIILSKAFFWSLWSLLIYSGVIGSTADSEDPIKNANDNLRLNYVFKVVYTTTVYFRRRLEMYKSHGEVFGFLT